MKITSSVKLINFSLALFFLISNRVVHALIMIKNLLFFSTVETNFFLTVDFVTCSIQILRFLWIFFSNFSSLLLFIAKNFSAFFFLYYFSFLITATKDFWAPLINFSWIMKFLLGMCLISDVALHFVKYWVLSLLNPKTFRGFSWVFEHKEDYYEFYWKDFRFIFFYFFVTCGLRLFR